MRACFTSQCVHHVLSYPGVKCIPLVLSITGGIHYLVELERANIKVNIIQKALRRSYRQGFSGRGRVSRLNSILIGPTSAVRSVVSGLGIGNGLVVDRHRK